MSSFVPTGFATITPYLMVNDAEGFLVFLTDVLGGEELQVTRDDSGVVHAEVRVLGSVLEFSEAREPWPATAACLHCYVPDADAVMARMLEAGCTLLYDVTEHPYGERSGGVADRWGVRWFVATVTDMAKRTGNA